MHTVLGSDSQSLIFSFLYSGLRAILVSLLVIENHNHIPTVKKQTSQETVRKDLSFLFIYLADITMTQH